MSEELGQFLDVALRAAQQRLAHVEGELAALRADRGAGGADDEHDPEGTPLSEEWSRLMGVREQANRELAELASARARMVDGTYGVCVDCGKRISPARLEARPTAERCVACAEKASR